MESASPGIVSQMTRAASKPPTCCVPNIMVACVGPWCSALDESAVVEAWGPTEPASDSHAIDLAMRGGCATQRASN